MKPRRDRGLTSIELTVVIIVVGISAAVTVPALLRGARNAVVVRCEARLKALWKLDSDRRTQGQPMPDAKGSAYWAALVGASGDPDSLSCPAGCPTAARRPIPPSSRRTLPSRPTPRAATAPARAATSCSRAARCAPAASARACGSSPPRRWRPEARLPMCDFQWLTTENWELGTGH